MIQLTLTLKVISTQLLSKCQSLSITVLFRNMFTQTIIFHSLTTCLLGSHLSLCNKYLLNTFCLHCSSIRHFFALPTNPGEQFFTFTSLAAWLLTCCGRNFEQPQEVNFLFNTISRYMMILLALAPTGLL